MKKMSKYLERQKAMQESLSRKRTKFPIIGDVPIPKKAVRQEELTLERMKRRRTQMLREQAENERYNQD